MVVDRRAELGRVGKVEELCPELQAARFRHGKTPLDSQVQIALARPAQYAHTAVAKIRHGTIPDQRGSGKRRRIEISIEPPG